MSIIAKVTNRVIGDLFEKVKYFNIVEYVFLILRVRGIGTEEDYLISLKKEIVTWDIVLMSNEDLIKKYKYIVTESNFLDFLINLVSCSYGRPYLPFPLTPLYKGTFPNEIAPSRQEVIEYLFSLAQGIQSRSLYIILQNIFPSDIIIDGKILTGVDIKKIRKAVGYYKEFVTGVLDVYSQKIKEFTAIKKNLYPYNKLRDFTVLEYLVNDDGLYGCKFYFSNGESAFYERTEQGTIGMNLFCADDGVHVNVGRLDKLKKEWMVLDQPFYIFGLGRRYNAYGEWKPLIYDGDIDLLDNRLKELLKDERGKSSFDDLYGVYKYIMATSFHGIEFIVKTNIKMPSDQIHFNVGDNKFQLSRVPFENGVSNTFSSLFVYDCSVILSDISIENVKSMINSISIIFSRMSFQLDAKFEIIYKYPSVDKSRSAINLEQKNIDNLINYFECFADNDAPFLDLAIQWFVSGNNSDNVFHKFLSYCISLECIAIPLIDGKLKASSEFSIKPEKITNADKIKCMQNIQSTEIDWIKFVERSYFECVLSLKNKIKNSLETVLGAESKEVQLFFKKIKYKRKDYSIYDLRSALAHGDFSENDPDDLNIIEENVNIIAQCCNKFIFTILEKKANGKNINIEKGRTLTILTADPRSTGIASTLSFIPNTDWRIKIDWLF
jgi:hypothetical protein